MLTFNVLQMGDFNAQINDENRGVRASFALGSEATHPSVFSHQSLKYVII